MKRTVALSAVLVLLAAHACSNADSRSGESPSVPRATNGSLRLGLEVAPGVLIDSVDYRITGSGIELPMIGAFTLNGTHGSGFIGVVNDIPAGTDRTIALAATASSGATCTGSGMFDVQANATSLLNVILECRDSGGTVIVRVTADQCPLLRSISASPDSAAVGSDIALVAVASDPDGDALSIAWTATSGDFSDPSSLSTTYTCTGPGTRTITAQVSKTDGSCSDSTSFDVTCTSAPDAGAGGAGGTTGSGGSGGAASTCGNGAVDVGEECDTDAFDGATCSSVTMSSLPIGNLACTAGCKFDISGCSSACDGGGAGGGTGTCDGGPSAGGNAG